MIKHIGWIGITCLLVACSTQVKTTTPSVSRRNAAEEQILPLIPSQQATQVPSKPIRARLDDLGPAPELENEIWLNVEGPLRLEDLRGKVILLDMWTFG